ncbi:MAG TPA: hypothetical protein VLT59_17385 [Steroidobacteraceae bacterium]|nr:hypothetical protein [Steroidobacteraceae bacterium]
MRARARMTTLIATSVVRGSRQGESHGGVFLIDLDTRKAWQPLDWNTMSIDWQGRGWDRGLRGIAFDGETVYIAASDELFAYTPRFELIDSWRNPYLKHCHEIVRHERMLFLTSTGFDSVLGFDLDRRRFTFGLHVWQGTEGFTAHRYDPGSTVGPPAANTLHLNNVHCTSGGMYVSGLRTAGVLLYNGREINKWVELPTGVHNARPFGHGVLFNDTQADVVRYATPSEQRVFRVPQYPQGELTHTDLDDARIARQGFGRGLAVINESTIAAGSSPSTITVHDLRSGTSPIRVNLTMDVRNAIHGLEVWPFG